MQVNFSKIKVIKKERYLRCFLITKPYDDTIAL